MKQRRELVEFLFGGSQTTQEQEALADDLLSVWEKLDQQERLEPKKTPLAAALKELGVEAESLQEDPEGFSYTVSDNEVYHKTNELLSSSEAVEKLAELGWVASKC